MLPIATMLGLWLLALSYPIAEGAVEIGSLPNLQHGVRGTLFATDEVTLFIKDFEYDGFAPAVYAYVFERGVDANRFGGGIKLSWSDRSNDGRISTRYTGQNVTVSLRDQLGGDSGLTINDIGHFTIWCEQFDVFFTQISIPENLDLDPPPSSLQHCAQLNDNFQASWVVNETLNLARFQLCACIEPDQYMAFGISGSNTSTFMVGADVIVAWVDNGQPFAVDYFLSSRQQCRGGVGVCPDTMITGGVGSQDVFDVRSIVTNTLTCVQYSRNLTTDDVYDLPILTGQSQYIAWAIGPRAVELGDLAFFHSEWPSNGVNVRVNFQSGPDSGLQCAGSQRCAVAQVCGWTGQSLTAANPSTFRVRIGPSGGDRGYQFITERSGWGIAFYINDMLIPVLRLQRNVKYTFIVEAGNDRSDGPNYHPFYITSSTSGGILLNTGASDETVYGGFNTTTNTPTAAGRHCQHVETAQSAAVALDCTKGLQDYQNTLQVSCQGSESEAAILEWTPDENTPDVVYYQCANHLNLGWKIDFRSGATETVARLSMLSLMVSVVLAAVYNY